MKTMNQHNGFEIGQKRYGTVVNAKKEADLQREGRSYGRVDLAQLKGDQAFIDYAIRAGAITREESKSARVDVSDKGVVIIIPGGDSVLFRE